MLVVAECTNTALDQAFINFRGQPKDFLIWLESLMTTTQIRHLLTTDGINVVKRMLSDERERDFLLTLDMLLHANIADPYILYKGMLNCLSASIAPEGFATDGVSNNSGVNLLGEEYMSRTVSRADAMKLLQNNKVLVTILCICLYGRPRYFIEDLGNGKVAVREHAGKEVTK